MMDVQEHNQAPRSLRSAAIRRRKSAEAGQALLEFAFLLPLLCLLSIGIVEIGRVVAYTVAVNNAATAGVEYGAQNPATASDIAGMQTYARRDASNNWLPGTVTATATFGCLCDTGSSGSYSGVSCTYPVPASSTCATIAATCTGQPVECVQVTTNMTINSLFNYPGPPSSYQANGKAVMRVRN
jgi:Flp pilus assembly protein TadG